MVFKSVNEQYWVKKILYTRCLMQTFYSLLISIDELVFSFISTFEILMIIGKWSTASLKFGNKILNIWNDGMTLE